MASNESREFAYSNQPVILILSSKVPEAGQELRLRLALFFDIDLEAVEFKERRGLAAFYIPGSYLVNFGRERVFEEAYFAATASPIFDQGIAGDDTGELLAKFAKDATSGVMDPGLFPTPMSLFYADFATGVGRVANDTFGMGRMYVTRGEEFAAISNNIAATGLFAVRGE